MSGFLDNMHERHKERREERREAHHERHDRRGRFDDHDNSDNYDNYGSQQYGRPRFDEDDDVRRPPFPPGGGQGLGQRFAPPSGPPPSAGRGASAFGSLGGLDRGDFASDADIDRMVSSGEFNERPKRQEFGSGYGGSSEVRGGYGAPSGPPPGRGSNDRDRASEYGRYDAPPGPPSGRQEGFGSGDGYGSIYGGGSDRRDQYTSQTGRAQYDSPQGLPPSYGSGQGKTPSGGFGDQYTSQKTQGRAPYESSSRQEGYGSGGRFGSSHDGESERRDQYGSKETQGRTQYDSPQGAPVGQGRGQGNTPSGGFGDQYSSQKTQGRAPYESSEQPSRQGGGFGSDSGFETSYGESERQAQYGSKQTQGRTQYDTPGGPPGQGKGQGNTPSGGFSASRDGDEYGSGFGKSGRNEAPRRGEAASYYNQTGSSGQDDRYGHLGNLAKEHDDNHDPDLYRRATQGLQEKIQAQSGRPKRDDDDEYKSQLDAHRKAYGNDDHGPMDADSIGAAAAMEAIKQSASLSGSSNAPAGAFKAGGGSSSKPGRPQNVDDEEEETAGGRSGGSGGGMQDKLMALAMSKAGSLFDKKNAGSGGGDKSGDKAQAMQSAAATAMQLFGKYQTGKLDSSDMSSVMTLAMKMM